MITTRTRASRIARVVAAVLVGALAVTGCVPAEDGDDPAPQLRLYTGDIPDPAHISPAGFVDVPEMPEPPSDSADEEAWAEYQELMLEYIEQYQNDATAGLGDVGKFSEDVVGLVEKTRRSDAESVAAWQALFVASGIAVGVGAEAVEINGSTGVGIPVTFPELRLLALAGATRSGMPLTELAYVLEGLEIFDGEELAEALYDDLTGAFASEFGVILLQLSPEAFRSSLEGPLRAYDEVTLSAAQVSLILRRLSAELVQRGYELGGQPSASAPRSSVIRTASLDTGSLRTDAGRACDLGMNPWEQIGQEQIGKGLGAAFGTLFEKVGGPTAGAYFGAASLLASLAAVIAKMWLMDASFSMPNSPLVRTKTTQKGEQRDLRIKFMLDEAPWQEAAECLKQILEPLGFDMPFADPAGAMEGIDVTLKLLDDSRLWLDGSSGGTDTYVDQTGSDGVVVFGLVGQPQKSDLPETAEEDDVTSLLRADANVNNSSFAKQMRALPWLALGGPLGALPGLLERWKLMSYRWDAPVRDWRAETDFEVTLAGTITAHTGQNMTFLPVEHCSGSTTNRSTTTTGTFGTMAPEKVTAQLLTDGGQQAVLLRATHPDMPQPNFVNNEHDGFRQFELFLKYQTEKSYQEPGTAPMPDHVTQQPAGCGDGVGGYVPPPDDCGPAFYTAVDWVHNDGDVLHLLHDRWVEDHRWEHCGYRHWPMDPAATPVTLKNCPAAEITGQLPPAHVIFDAERTGFEVVGTLDCYEESDGTLHMVDVDWTMTFCRIIEGEPAC